MRSLATLLALTGASCWGQQGLITAAKGPDEISYTQIEIGMDSPLKKSGVKVIRDPDAWKKFLTTVDELSLKRPVIDWAKYQIVIATLEGSTKSGVALQLVRLHKVAHGTTDIEFELSKETGSNRYMDPSTSHNTIGKSQFPYVVIQTPRMDTKWDIKVFD